MLNRSNFWQGEGNLSRDPEIHVTPQGVEVVHFTIAVSGAGSGQGEKDSAGFFDCKIWLTENDFVVPAEIRAAREGFKGDWKKGTRIQVMGRLIQERWEKDGEKRNRVIVLADKVQAFNFRKDNEGTTTTAVASNEEYTPNRQSTVPEQF